MLLRVTTGDVALHGTVLPDGQRVLLLVGSANRDADVFAEPDRYDIDRDTSKLVSFGSGRHFCLGAALARLEARVGLEELLHRVADYEIEAAGTERVHSINVRGFAHLPTTVSVH
jgi:cytochrome P450